MSDYKEKVGDLHVPADALGYACNLAVLAQDLLHKFGYEAQLDKFQEELAEVIVAISHRRLGREGHERELMEELADLCIMYQQVLLIFCETGKYDDYVRIVHEKMDKARRFLRDSSNESAA